MVTNNNQNTQSKTMYISTIDSGIKKVTPIGYNSPEPIVNDKIAYILTVEQNPVTQQSQQVIKNVRFSSEESVDEREVIRSEVSDLFGINTPKAQKVYDEGKKEGVLVSTNIGRGDQPFRISSYFSEINRSAQIGMFKDSYPECKLAQNTADTPFTDMETIKIVINKGINALPKTQKSDIVKDYINMILLDLIMGQKTRGGMDYWIVRGKTTNSVGEEEISARLVPGIANYEPSSNDEYLLNDFYVDRKALLECLINEYPQYTKGILSPLQAVRSRYKNCISRIIYNNTDRSSAEHLEALINTNIDKICECLNKQKSEENKVELALTTTQLNLTIERKETEILNKYPKNPKEEVETVEENLDDGVRILSLEEPKSSAASSGYVSAALIGSIISFVLGLGIGIAYILLQI